MSDESKATEATPGQMMEALLTMRDRQDAAAAPSSGAIKVTVTDPENGEVLGERVIENDYMLICAGNRYLEHTEATIGGTHVLTVMVAARLDRATKENNRDRKRRAWENARQYDE